MNNSTKFIAGLFFVFTVMYGLPAFAQQNINDLVNKARTKLESVNSYQASGKMKTNVTFLKVPVANVSVYFKKPNKLKIKSEKGISFIPKGAVNINMGSIVGSTNFTIIDAGTDKVGNIAVRVAKLLPNDDNADVVLSTLYIQESTGLVYKAKTTTKDNGTYELQMTYGKYASYALPDKILFSFNTKDYKLPKGVTFDFDAGTTTKDAAADKVKNKRGSAEITFSNYVINQPIPDSIFK